MLLISFIMILKNLNCNYNSQAYLKEKTLFWRNNIKTYLLNEENRFLEADRHYYDFHDLQERIKEWRRNGKKGEKPTI